MKKYILIFAVSSFSAILFLSFPINSKNNFVSIQNNSFRLNDKYFYPVAMNYIVSVQADKNGIWACPFKTYNTNLKHRFITKDSSLLELKADMDLIKEMGFNTVRIVGIGELAAKDRKKGVFSLAAQIKNDRDTTVIISDEASYKNYLDGLDELFGVINKAGLKIIFLVHLSPEINGSEDNLRKIASRFNKDTAVMAYDLFNEPLYFDTLQRKKEDVAQFTKRWKKIVRMYAPNQLVTIGLEGIREVFEWDPNIIDVDFVSLHPYNHEPDQVMNEIYWYSKYIKKPWMIGETAITADNDSVPYEDQKAFANKTLKQAYNCGAMGYSWWQYKDVEWHDFVVDFQGVVTRTGETKTMKANITVHGTQKPVVEEFKKFDPTSKKDSCICLKNYYNYSDSKTFRMKGFLKDENDKPIEGGVILAWNQYWSKSYHTTSKEDGSFELLGPFPFYHWMASAGSYSMIRADISPDLAKTSGDGIPTLNIGDLKIKKLKL